MDKRCGALYLPMIIQLLHDKVDQLNKINKKFGVNMLFMTVVRIEDGIVPGKYLRRSAIEFLNAINAEFGFDVYVYS